MSGMEISKVIVEEEKGNDDLEDNLGSKTKSILEEILSMLSEEYIEEHKDAFKEMKTSAEAFLLAYNMKEDDTLNNPIAGRLSLNEESIYNSYSNYRKENKAEEEVSKLRSLYLKAFEFSEKLNSFLYGENYPSMGAYVYEDSKGNLRSYEIPLKDMVQYIDKTGHAKLSEERLKKLNAKNIEEAFKKESKSKGTETNLKPAQLAYKGAKNRLEIYYQNRFKKVREINETRGKDNQLSKGYLQRQGGLLLWKKNRRWQMLRVANAGDLKEAYLAFAVSTDIFKGKLGLAPLYSDELIEEYVKYIKDVDSMSAILREDVLRKTGENKGIQYAVKSGKFSLPSINQYVKTAKIVANITGSDLKDLQKRIVQDIFNEYGEGALHNLNVEIKDHIKEIEENKIIKTTKRQLNKIIKNSLIKN